MRKMKAFLLYVFAWLLISDVGIALPNYEDIVVELENGCTLTRRNSTTPFKGHWFDTLYPHLNCSGGNLTRLNVEGVLEDTRSITLSYNDMIEFHIDDLALFPNLEKLDLKSNKLARIVMSATDPILVINSTKHLSLTHNLLDKIPNEALRSFPNLQSLLMFSNKIDHIYYNDFRFNPKLQNLYLGPNPIRKFEDEWLGRLNLTGLNLRGCGLTELPKNVGNMSSLIYLDMSDNAITEVPPGGFSGCTGLYWLELASNKIESIGNGSFKGCSKLRMLDLSDNQLSTLAAQTFDGISKESLEIDLYENPIRCDCSSAGFKSWYDNVKEIDMANEVRYKCEQPLRNHGKKSHQLSQTDYICKDDDVKWQDCNSAPTSSSTTTSLPPKTSPSLGVDDPLACPNGCACFNESGKIYSGSEDHVPRVGFRYYKMSYPSVVCISRGLSSIPVEKIRSDVKFMMMSDNKITTLDITQLKKFTKLVFLDLKKNNIKSMKASSGTVLPNVSVLNLRFNNISTVTKDHMQSFPNLKVLALYHNLLTSIPKDVFAKNRKLQRIYLGPNPTKKFDGSFLKGLDLISLSLRNMSLTQVPSQIGSMKNLSYLDLSDNKISGLKNGTFSKCASLYRLVLENNQISSVQANAFNGATNLRMILLSENELTFLSKGVFSNVSNERLVVELWRNEFICDCKLRWLKEWIDQTDAKDPTTDIRFQCAQPARLHDQVSDKLTPEDFICQDGEPTYEPESVCKVCQSPIGPIALAVVLTFLATVVCCVIAWRCTFRRRYSELLHYAKQRDDVYDEMAEM